MSFLRDVWLVFQRYMWLFLRNPVWVIIGVIQPVFYLLLFAPLLESIAHQEVVPLGQGQELLQGLGSHVGGDGDGLDALPGQVGELPLDINAEMMSSSIIDEALVEESEEPLNSRA